MANLSYLNAISKRLKAQKNGIAANAAAWVGQPDTPATNQAHIDALETMDTEVKTLETQLTQKRQAARTLAQQKAAVADAIDLRVQGIHATTPSKWIEYGLTDPTSDAYKARTTRPVPDKCIVKSVIDDYDGIGFIVEIQTLPNADMFEIERGVAANAEDVNTIPTLAYLTTTRKLKYTDDDVDKGKRYFYRCRGINSKGVGEWSECVSRVQ